MANRLEFEDSPYLQQHKNNPIDWYPWGEEAFRKAKNEHKAIFISIGYSSCHWCHVMEKDVFEQQEAADFVNEHFVCIKVDREERPDIDKHYQEVYQLLNRRPGGWPTSIFATPQNKPFFAATYMPLHNNEGHVSMMGFMEVTKIIADKIALNDEQIFKNADEITSYLKPKERNKEATKLTEDIYKTFMQQAKNAYEIAYGGFSTAPKFPQSATLKTLMNLDLLYGNNEAKEMVNFTLQNMTKGGLYDLVDGGFCRYSTDDLWMIPHFEKMTYDNALLCELYTKAYAVYKKEVFLHVAMQTADFMHDFMQDGSLFYSASDADSDGEEGLYFTYTKEEVENALIMNGYDDNMDVILKELHVMKLGNFEGRNIIRYDKEQKPEWFENVMHILKSLRSQRQYPFIDKKVQTSWNAMMIKALFTLGNYENRYKEKAKYALDALLKTMYKENTLYHSTLMHKEPKIEAFLEDYAYLGCTLAAAYESTGDEMYLITAQKLANTALEKYYENGRWFFSKGEFTTEAELQDATYPSAISLMVDLLLSLGAHIEEKYRSFAFKTLEYYSYDLSRRPLHYPYMLDMMLRYLKEERIVKSDTQKLQDAALILQEISYPYVLKHHTNDAEYLICGLQSCFAAAKEKEELEHLLKGSL